MEKLDFLIGIISEENNALHDIVQAIEANGNASIDGLYTFFRYKYYSYKSYILQFGLSIAMMLAVMTAPAAAPWRMALV